ncbi:MAG: transaldolase [Acidimicrobiales bacterium]
MTKLQDLYRTHGQSPWLDNLSRDGLADGSIARWVERGVRGLTSNPTIFQKAMSAGDRYDAQLAELVGGGASVEEAYWQMVTTDIADALALLRPVYDRSGGSDGFVSLELAPALARDTPGSIDAARRFHDQVARPNLLVKIPATPEGIPAIRQMVSEGRNINITLIFSLERYAEVMEAYLSGLEAFEGDRSTVHSVASFFVSRIDTEVDRRLEAIGTPEAGALRGRTAVAQAKLAYRAFRRAFSGPRWEALARSGAHLQRPLWASTSTKSPDYPPTLYVDSLIGPDTVNTMPPGTLDAFEGQGTLARTADAEVEDAESVFDQLSQVGVDMADVSQVVEDEGVAAFAKSFDEAQASLEAKTAEVAGRS